MVSVVISESAHEVDHRKSALPWQGKIPGGADESMGP